MKYKFSFVTDHVTWKSPRVEMLDVLGEYFYNKTYNVKRVLLSKERHVQHFFGEKYISHRNKWLFSFTIDITPKEAFELGEVLNRKYDHSVKYYSRKGCNVH